MAGAGAGAGAGWRWGWGWGWRWGEGERGRLQARYSLWRSSITERLQCPILATWTGTRIERTTKQLRRAVGIAAFSPCRYFNASQPTQDDVFIISTKVRQLADDFGDTQQTGEGVGGTRVQIQPSGAAGVPVSAWCLAPGLGGSCRVADVGKRA